MIVFREDAAWFELCAAPALSLATACSAEGLGPKQDSPVAQDSAVFDSADAADSGTTDSGTTDSAADSADTGSPACYRRSGRVDLPLDGALLSPYNVRLTPDLDGKGLPDMVVPLGADARSVAIYRGETLRDPAPSALVLPILLSSQASASVGVSTRAATSNGRTSPSSCRARTAGRWRSPSSSSTSTTMARPS